MDYGSQLKSTIGNRSVQSSTYRKQTTFKGSARYVRGQILKLLINGKCSKPVFYKALVLHDVTKIDEKLHALAKEGLINNKGAYYWLPE